MDSNPLASSGLGVGITDTAWALGAMSRCLRVGTSRPRTSLELHARHLTSADDAPEQQQDGMDEGSTIFDLQQSLVVPIIEWDSPNLDLRLGPHPAWL